MLDLATIAQSLKDMGLPVKGTTPESPIFCAEVNITDTVHVEVGTASRHMEVVQAMGEGSDEFVFHGTRCGSVDSMLAAVAADLRALMGPAIAFEWDGCTYSLDELLQGNTYSPEVCDWARGAQPGDSFEGCVCVAKGE